MLYINKYFFIFLSVPLINYFVLNIYIIKTIILIYL